MSEEERRRLEEQLWNIANELRGKMGADEFRDYILGFIFYKYLSEKMMVFGDYLLKSRHIHYADLDVTKAEHQKIISAVKKAAVKERGFFLAPDELFTNIVKKGAGLIKILDEATEDEEVPPNKFILDDIATTLKNIENSTLGADSQDDFINLFEDLDLTSTKLGNTAKARNQLVAKVLSHLDKIDFRIDDPKADLLGDAYEYLIAQFASGSGKKAGEFYTPQPVSTLLAKLVTSERKKLSSVYDPTCGSGSLLLRVTREAKANGSEVDHIYGQEQNRTTYNLARMNMILHDVHYSKFSIKQEDTLKHPQHKGMEFDAIVANPPFSAVWEAKPSYLSDERFAKYGKLAPKTKADMAFIQHMLYHLAEDGIMATLMPHGVLFRGAAEGHIRQYLIEDMNALDAVIGLPANLFYSTSIPTSILVFKKCRKHDDHILFIDASQDFEKVKTQNALRPQDIEKIVNAYKNRSSIDKYSRPVPLTEIKENDYNLNIPRYIDTFEEEEQIDLEAVATEIQQIQAQMQSVDKTIADFCKELGIKAPF